MVVASRPLERWPEVHEAAERWAHGVVGAPRHFASLIERVDCKDEVLHRVYTEIVRRELKEERGPASERNASRPRVDAADVDPFVHTEGSLRSATEHVGACITCRGGGRVPCVTCHGSTQAPCHSCAGVGRFRNPATNRMNNCKVCKTTGKVVCGNCGASGGLPCKTCSGSGHQRVWQSFVETRLGRVAVVPESPAVQSQRALLEARMLHVTEVTNFALQGELRASGPLAAEALDADARAVVQRLSAVDSRLERISQQQYMRLAAVRRDITYQMCGTAGTFVLAGRDLKGEATAAAIRPIRRRLILWPSVVLFVGFFSVIPSSTIAGKSAYFDGARGATSLLWLLALGLSVVMFGGLLRAWRPGFKWTGLRKYERVSAGLWALALVAMAVVGLIVRPTVQEAEAALAAGHVQRARAVVDALRETEGGAKTVIDLEDAVLMMEAAEATGEARLAKLDAVSAHHGEQANAAAAAAHSDRLAEIQGLIAARHVDEAIAAIDRSFAETWRADPEISEQRARAHELQAERCDNEPCRLVAWRAAQDALGSDARASAVGQTRARIADALVNRQVEASVAIERARQLGAVLMLGDHTEDMVKDDEELIARARAAKAWAVQERGTIPLLGADRDTVQELLAEMRLLPSGIAWASLSGTDVYFNFDAQGLCRGIYAVGAAAAVAGGKREMHSQVWPADRLLSQALGYAAKVKLLAKPASTSLTWKESGTRVTARWRDGKLVELRIGDATP